MDVVPFGNYTAMAVSPLASGRLDPPDICLIYATPGQMMILINGLQWSGYRKFEWSVVGESACADSWGRALLKSEPSLAIPCFAERRYGGVLDDELLMAMPPKYLPQAIAGMKRLSGQRPPLPDPPVRHPVRRAGGPCGELRVATLGYAGRMFWFRWKTLSGSYSAFTCCRRA